MPADGFHRDSLPHQHLNSNFLSLYSGAIVLHYLLNAFRIGTTETVVVRADFIARRAPSHA